jgi:hypothetical protein
MSEDGSRITLTMPEARTIYWESANEMPDTVTLRLEFPGNGRYDYDIETFKVLDQSVEVLKQRKIVLFCPHFINRRRVNTSSLWGVKTEGVIGADCVKSSGDGACSSERRKRGHGIHKRGKPRADNNASGLHRRLHNGRRFGAGDGSACRQP